MAYWHSFCGTGSDLFGPGTRMFPWDSSGSELEKAKYRLDTTFEFMSKLGIPFYCPYATDLVGDGPVFDIEKRLDKILPEVKQRQQETGIYLFSTVIHPRY